MFSRAGDLFDATGKFTSWESARIYGLASPVPESVLEHIPEQIKGDINEVRKMQHLLHFLFKKRVKMFPSLWSFLRGIFLGEGLIVIHKMRKLKNPLHEEACKRGIHHAFETHVRRHQNSKTGVSHSEAPQ